LPDIALRSKDLARLTVDIMVQPKNITFPTDAKLLDAAIKDLNRLAHQHGMRLRQSYVRIAGRAAMMARALRPHQAVLPPPSRTAHPAHAFGPADP
jgi:hypothetical protein